ncbi:MAG: thermonuclease family protein [Capsulimonadales bacterium]|nr:thermonuclease family protein [Capsulimonadales bacterium]
MRKKKDDPPSGTFIADFPSAEDILGRCLNSSPGTPPQRPAEVHCTFGNRLWAASVLLALLLFAFPALAQDLAGKVVGVHDGDTITLLTESDGRNGQNGQKRSIKIRLNGIDAPETDQPFGQASKQFASKAVFGQQITVKSQGQDRYGRTLGVVMTADGKNLNQALVKNGYAWWYRKYAPNDGALKQLEFEARQARRGLWAESRIAIAPWEWRSGRRANPPPQVRTRRATITAPAIEKDVTVWVNTNSGIYHYPGQRWFGNTKHGMFMKEKDAQAQGYRATMNGQ